jgi:hypothetical protein
MSLPTPGGFFQTGGSAAGTAFDVYNEAEDAKGLKVSLLIIRSGGTLGGIAGLIASAEGAKKEAFIAGGVDMVACALGIAGGMCHFLLINDGPAYSLLYGWK